MTRPDYREKARELIENVGINGHYQCDDSCSKKGLALDVALQALHDAHLAGRREGVEASAKVCDAEGLEYEKSMQEFDRLGDIAGGTNEARRAATAQYLADAIRALLRGGNDG